MTENEDPAYYHKRAEQEQEAAEAASNALAKVIHLNLAERYRVKAWESEDATKIRLVRD